MLIENCLKAEEKILRLEHLRQDARRLNDYTVRRERLDEASEALQSIATTAASMRVAGIKLSLQHALLTEVALFAGEIQRLLLENPELVVEPNRYDFTGFARNATAVVNDIRPLLLTKWREWVESHERAPSDEMLDLLARIGHSGHIVEIRSISRQLTAISLKLPASDADVNRVRQLAERMASLLGDLHTKEIPEPVWVFLRAAGARTGADLALLTSPVLEWLREQNVHNHFCILWKA